MFSRYAEYCQREREGERERGECEKIERRRKETAQIGWRETQQASQTAKRCDVCRGCTASDIGRVRGHFQPEGGGHDEQHGQVQSSSLKRTGGKKRMGLPIMSRFRTAEEDGTIPIMGRFKTGRRGRDTSNHDTVHEEKTDASNHTTVQGRRRGRDTSNHAMVENGKNSQK